MARRRYISTEISIDRDVNKLGSEYGAMAVLLYTWMIPHAEDDRSITAHADEIILSVIPGFRDTSIQDVEGYINGMLELGLLEAGENKDRLYFPEESFYKYQSYVPESKRNKCRKSPRNTEEHRGTPQITTSPSPSPSPSPSEREIDIRAREEEKSKKIDTDIRSINDKAFEFGMNGVTPEFVEDAEIRLKEGVEVELITKALSMGATNASGNAGVKCRYAIRILQTWAAEGIKTIAQWNEKNTPKARDKPTKADRRIDAVKRARKIAHKMLDEQEVGINDTS